MKGKKNIVIGLVCLLLILFFAILSYFKMTYSYFGNNITGQLGTLCSVNYFSNYPKDFDKEDLNLSDAKIIHSDYVVKNNVFEIPEGFQFAGWNTMSDGSGTTYNVNDNFQLTRNTNLYAIWISTLHYGDINLDGKVNLDDSVLLDKYIKDNITLDNVLLSNADINLDGKVDLVDVDIIKQAVLGTKGYGDLLSNNPVRIYKIYVNSGNNNNNGGSNSSNNVVSSGGTSSNNSGNSNNDSSSLNNDSSNEKDDISNSVDNNTNINDLTKEDEKEKKDKKKSYAFILVIGILLLSLRLVIFIIKKIIKIKKSDININ